MGSGAYLQVNQANQAAAKGDWVHYAKIAFEKFFLRKMRRGESEPFYERFVLDKLGIRKIKTTA